MSESLVPKFRIGGLKLPDYPASNVRHLQLGNLTRKLKIKLLIVALEIITKSSSLLLFTLTQKPTQR